MLTRLAAKNAVSERKRGNTSVYEPLISRRKACRSALSSLINQAFDGAVEPIIHFLVKDRKFTEKQHKELIQILQEEDKKKQRLHFFKKFFGKPFIAAFAYLSDIFLILTNTFTKGIAFSYNGKSFSPKSTK